jgi:hypothetical protein
MVSAVYLPHFSFLDRSRYFFFEVAPHLSSRAWMDPVPDPLLRRKCSSAGNRSRDLWVSSQGLWALDHRGGRMAGYTNFNLNWGDMSSRCPGRRTRPSEDFETCGCTHLWSSFGTEVPRTPQYVSFNTVAVLPTVTPRLVTGNRVLELEIEQARGWT